MKPTLILAHSHYTTSDLISKAIEPESFSLIHVSNTTSLETSTITRAELVLIDVEFNQNKGLDIAQQLMLLHPACRCVIFIPNCPIWAQKAFDYDISGYLPLEPETNELIHCLDVVQQRRRYLSPSIATYLQMASKQRINKVYVNSLSNREKDVLQGIYNGLSNPQIADKLGVSITTINTHKQNMVSKLSLKNRRALMVVATQLFELPT